MKIDGIGYRVYLSIKFGITLHPHGIGLRAFVFKTEKVILLHKGYKYF